jgi:hypothetical protein
VNIFNRTQVIKKEELKHLDQRVELLKELTGRICREKIEGFVK